ncbi:MAG: hypothetical protein J3R72DRAFT_524118 [Linnemannia gamsii]|nr:MAG: hypothetical protein J3R72DRAFT_524118 [Linnemannia gamsii]
MQDLSPLTSNQDTPTTVSVITKAILMPELLLLIAKHLTPPTLARSFLVCRTWHILLEPFLWQTFTYPAPEHTFAGSSSSLRGRQQPTADQFERMSPRIQRFICLQDLSPTYPALITALIPQCRDQLVQLEVYFTVPEVDALLSQNQGSLRKLGIVSNMYRPDKAHLVRQVLSERIVGMRLLEELTLRRFHVSQGEQGEAFLEICQRLKVLELRGVKVDIVVPSRARRMRERGQGYGQEQKQETSGDGHTEPFTLPRLRKLKLDRVIMDNQQQVALWKACTHLEDFTWSLVRLNLNESMISDQDFSRLLDLLPNLEALAANLSLFGPLALATLLGDESPEIKDNNVNYERASGSRRAHRWRELSLKGCFSLTGLDAQMILTSCPSLKVFAGGPMYITELISLKRLLSTTISNLDSLSSEATTSATSTADTPLQDRPWACTSLENLDVRFLLCTEDEPRTGTVPAQNSSEMQVRRAVIYNRIATLTRLKTLSLSNTNSVISHPDIALMEKKQGIGKYGLDLSLKYEMARLAPLKRLQQLRLYHLEGELQIGEEELRWMEREFPDLVAVVGSCEREKEMETENRNVH